MTASNGQRALSPGERLVKVEGLHKSFNHMGNVLEVLKGIDLEIAAGELLTFLEKMRFLTRVEPRDATAELRSTQVWGIPVAELLSRPLVRRTLAARGTPPGAVPASAIRAGTAFEELADALLEAAGREALLRRLGEALARTSRQVNTLERRIGPELRRRIGAIRRTLAEREREDLVRLTRRLKQLAGSAPNPYD